MPNIADFAYYRLVYDYLSNAIDKFGMGMLTRVTTYASAFALTLVTLWILIQGFRIATGRSRESLMEVVINMGRIVLIVAAATTMAIGSTDLKTFFTNDMDKSVHEMFTGNADQSTVDAIDQNLAYTQIALSTINSVQVVQGDAEMQASRDRSSWIATFGTASPPMTAGAMLLLYQFAISLFIGLGPLFILCLIFDQTKPLFQRWLLYGIGTIFSMALLSVVASMVLELTIRVSAALWGAKVVNSILGNSTEGLTSVSMQQGGIGLLLSILIVSVPPMAAMFFQGTLGSALTYSVFQGAGGRPGPQGQPAGSWGSSGAAAYTGGRETSSKTEESGFQTNSNNHRVVGGSPVTQADAVKTTRGA